MRMISIGLAAIAVAGSVPALAATIEVGPGKKYTTLSAASLATRSGDTVVIYPGTYTTGATWKASNITIKGAAGTKPSQIVIKNGAVGGKGLFLIQGSDVTVQGLHFAGAKVSSGNGAGIRMDGKNLTVINSEFVANQNGILMTSGSKVGTLKVSGSLFRNNGSGTGQTHGIYASQVGKVEITGSIFEGTKVGHHIKSRAPNTIVTNSTITDGTTGTASYLIDLPDGGAATITGNTLTKGANSSNYGTAIAFGFEQKNGENRINPAGPVVIADNVFTNLDNLTTAFVNNKSLSQTVTLSGNTLTGKVIPLKGAGTVSKMAAMTTDALDFNPEFATLDASGLGMSSAVGGGSGGGGAAFDGGGGAAIGSGSSAVPEPAAVALFGLGAGLLLLRRRKAAEDTVARVA